MEADKRYWSLCKCVYLNGEREREREREFLVKISRTACGKETKTSVTYRFLPLPFRERNLI